jgi:hypothetical protein
MAGANAEGLAQREGTLNQREASLQETMDRMLNQQQISLETAC